MANIQHKDITEANLHEPKGVSTASANKTYVSDGAGSGAWKKLPVAGIDSGSAVVGAFLQADGSGGVAVNPRMYRYAFNSGTLVSVAANTTVEQTINVAGLIAASDDVLQIIKPSHQPGLIVANARIAVDGQIIIQFANITSSAIVPTASETYTLLVWRR